VKLKKRTTKITKYIELDNKYIKLHKTERIIKDRSKHERK
jgi:hypothetical protein